MKTKYKIFEEKILSQDKKSKEYEELNIKYRNLLNSYNLITNYLEKELKVLSNDSMDFYKKVTNGKFSNYYDKEFHRNAKKIVKKKAGDFISVKTSKQILTDLNNILIGIGQNKYK